MAYRREKSKIDRAKGPHLETNILGGSGAPVACDRSAPRRGQTAPSKSQSVPRQGHSFCWLVGLVPR